MKHVNLDPDLERKKVEIMRQFREGNEPQNESQGEQPAHPPTDSPASAAASAPTSASANNRPSAEVLQQRVIEALKGIYDPEIPVNIYDLGLIYRVEIKEGFAEIDMTLTAPGCPVAQTFPGMVEGAVRLVPGISGAAVDLVWEPPWTQSLISEAARLELGLI